MIAVLAAAIFAGPVEGARTLKSLRVTPKVGKTRATFVAHFLAPYATAELADGGSQFYYYDGRGPAQCRRFGLGESGVEHRVGDRVRLSMTPDSIGTGKRTTWCPGRYTGKVYWYEVTKRGLVVRQHSVGRIAFEVRR